jgi:phenylalanine-4-hydroxylase
MSHLLQNCTASDEIIFSPEDHAMWHTLYSKQIDTLKTRAYEPFLSNLETFNLPTYHIPQLREVSDKLTQTTNWKVAPVVGLIDYEPYFHLLSQRIFPSTITIRKKQAENLSKDPDIFHEIFAHCTMLLSPNYADFMQEYAKFMLTVTSKDRPLFARLIWFTTETGLIQSPTGLKIFGSSNLSSYTESIYCLEQDEVIRKPFNTISIFREPYRADLLQKVYYVLEDVKQLFSLLDNISELYNALKTARRMGEYNPLFPIEKNKYCNIGHCKSLDIEPKRKIFSASSTT